MSPTMTAKAITKKILGIDFDSPEWKQSVRDIPSGELRANKQAILQATQALLSRVESEHRDFSNEERTAFDEGIRIAGFQSDELTRRALIDDTTRTVTREPGRYVETATGERVRLLRGDEHLADGIPSEPYNIGDVVRGLATGRWPNAEARDLAGASTTSGGVLLSPSVSARVIDMARAKTALVKAGALTLPMETGEMKVARVASDPTVQWRAENQAITASDITFQGVNMKARTCGVICKIPLELVEDASNLQTIIETTFSGAIATELDRVGLVGIGSAEEPLGIENTPGVLTATSVGSPIYEDVIDAVRDIRLQNGEPGAVIYSPRDVATLEKLRAATTDQFLIPPESFRNLKRLTTTLVPKTRGGGGNESLAFVGDFSNFWFGVRKSLTIEASRSAADSTSSAFSNVQLWLRAYVRVDVAVVRPTHFLVMSGIL